MVTTTNKNRSSYLLEANIVGVFPEALTANVQAVFTDQTVTVGAGAAKIVIKTQRILLLIAGTIAITKILKLI